MIGNELTKVVLENISNFHLDNHDYYRFGKPKEYKTFVHRLAYKFIWLLSKFGLVILRNNNRTIRKKYGELYPHMNGFQKLYENLNDQKSKELLTQLLAFNILGKHRVKLERNNSTYWQLLRKAESAMDKNDFVDKGKLRLNRFNLGGLGSPVQMYLTAPGILNDFLLKQYEYQISPDHTIQAAEGDFVIDAGGCFGDTAIYFADKVGDKGKVFVFEFIPSNLEMTGKNIEINPALVPIIQVVPSPLWDTPGKPLHYIDKGPGSKVTFDTSIGGSTVLTETIDNFVEKNQVPRIDFIKMDIEGAEVPALNGAVRTITKHKPKLAISVYHSLSDFYNVSNFILGIDSRYKLYLGHYTIHREETVLFATIDN